MKQIARRRAKGARWPLMVVLVLAACALALAACGGDDDEGDTNGGAANAPEGQPIVTWTYTDVNTEGPQYKNIEETARIYEEWVNSEGGIAGRPLETNFCDARGTPTAVAACGREAVAGNAVAVVGNFTFTGDAIIPILEKNNLAQWGNCCAIAPSELVSPISFPMGNQPLYSVGLVKKAVEDGCKKINGVIIEGAEAFIPLMKNAAKAEGTSIDQFVTLPATAQDFAPQVAEATSGDADCLVMIVSETPYIAWMPAFAQSGSDAVMYGPQGNLNEKVAEGFEEAVEGDVVAGMYPDISLSQWDDYRGALDEYNADMSQDYNSLGGMGTWAAYEGFKQVVESMDGEINNDTFLKAAETAQIDLPGMVPPLDFRVPWSKDGGPEGYDRLVNRCVVFSEFKDGELTPLGDEFTDVSEIAGGTKPMDCGPPFG
ncbi:MAG TPA: ABC transporter substrate-binding protein [Solirubrobacterales bacterium]